MIDRTRIERLPVQYAYAVVREHIAENPEMPRDAYDFVDMDTISASRDGALRLATMHDAAEPCYGKAFPLMGVVLATLRWIPAD